MVEPVGELAGSVSCRECHPAFYSLWESSNHGRTVRPYSSEVVGPFASPAEVDAGGERYVVDPRAGTVRQVGEGGAELEVAYAVGGRDVLYLLTPLERGRLQVLPVAWDVGEEAWFDTTASAVRHTGEGPVEGALPWTDRALTFNTACRDCHVSHGTTWYDAATDSYETSWAEPGISCEACHGPAAEHVRVCLAAGEEDPADLAIRRFGDLDHAQVNAACGACHARAVPLTGHFQPGDAFFDHFDLVTLEHPDHHPDGRDLGENYTLTSWMLSPCVANGELDCLHCHTASGRFRHAEQPDRACEPCHADRIAEVEAHSHHPCGASGGRCIDCHMPATEFARMRRSDHSMRPPTPSVAQALGSVDACTACHSDHDVAWATGVVRDWGGGANAEATLEWASLVYEARSGDFTRLGDMLAYIAKGERNEVVAASLLRCMRVCPNAAVEPALVGALDDRSPLVRAAAAATLGQRGGPGALRPLLDALDDPSRLVRVRAVRALAGLDEAALEPESRPLVAVAAAELEISLEVRPDDPRLLLERGNLAADRGRDSDALRLYEAALGLDPEGVEARVNAAMVHGRLGDPAQAEALLREASQRAPDDPAVNLDLGLLLAGLGRTDEAEAALRRALEADPDLAVAAYNLCALAGEARIDEAVTWCGRAVELEPGEARYGYALAFYTWRAGDVERAGDVAGEVLANHPEHAATRALMEQLK